MLLAAGAVVGGCVLALCVGSGVLPSWIELDGLLPGPNGQTPAWPVHAWATLGSAPIAVPPTHRGVPAAPASADPQSQARDRTARDAAAADPGLAVGRFWPGPTPAAPRVQEGQARARNGTPIEGAPEAGRPGGAPVQHPAAAPVEATQWDALYARGHQYQLEGNLVAAADAYRRAIQLNPEHAAALYDLGYVLQLEGQNEAAIDCYRRALAHQPRNAFAHYNLGTLLQAKGDARAAIAQYEEAAAIQPGNPYIYYDWARSLEAIGDAAGAVALYRKAIALGPNHRPGLDARRRLAALPPSRDGGVHIQ